MLWANEFHRTWPDSSCNFLGTCLARAVHCGPVRANERHLRMSQPVLGLIVLRCSVAQSELRIPTVGIAEASATRRPATRYTRQTVSNTVAADRGRPRVSKAPAGPWCPVRRILSVVSCPLTWRTKHRHTPPRRISGCAAAQRRRASAHEPTPRRGDHAGHLGSRRHGTHHRPSRAPLAILCPSSDARRRPTVKAAGQATRGQRRLGTLATGARRPYASARPFSAGL
jgi:hypothetical protein